MSLRQRHIQQLQKAPLDVLIIGGGINGAVAAAALSGRGVRVGLVEKSDFASETSSNSSNLAWGGIKYLENFEFGLVNQLCQSRNDLLKHFPSTVKEIRFLTTIAKGFRLPAWFIYLGTWLYWLMGRGKTRIPCYFFSPKGIKKREPVIQTANTSAGFEYSDCYLFDNDARFVFSFIRSAMDNDANCVNYVSAESAERHDGLWQVSLKDHMHRTSFHCQARVIINACGPFVDEFNQGLGVTTDYHHAFSKGVHLIVDKLGNNDKVLAFFASDGRLFFVIPMGSKTCIGTTDTKTTNPNEGITDEDCDFILDNANRLLELPTPLSRADIISRRCGVRPLAIKGEPQDQAWLQLSRKHIIEESQDKAVISIFGGKLTDCINVGEEVCDSIKRMGIPLPHSPGKWYGEPSAEARARFFRFADELQLDSFTPSHSREPLSERLWRRYGDAAAALARDIADECKAKQTSPEQTIEAEVLVPNTEYLFAELRHTAEREMVTTLEDLLRRRSKIAMVATRESILNSPNLTKACEILFAENAKVRLQEYQEQRLRE